MTGVQTCALPIYCAVRHVNSSQVESQSAQWRNEVKEHAYFQDAADLLDSVQARTGLWRNFIRIHKLEKSVWLNGQFLFLLNFPAFVHDPRDKNNYEAEE